MKFAIALVLVLAGIACQQGPVPKPPEDNPPLVKLVPGKPQARLALPAKADEIFVLDIANVKNAQQREVTLVVSFAEGNAGAQRISLYPPDQPARIAVRRPAGAMSARVALSGVEGPPELVELRALPRPD